MEAEGSLPAQWEKHWSAEHEEFYYWNKETKESRWTEPGKPEVDEALPPGWSKEYDAEKEEWYYWHKQSRTAHWELPELPDQKEGEEEGKEDSAAPEAATSAE